MKFGMTQILNNTFIYTPEKAIDFRPIQHKHGKEVNLLVSESTHEYILRYFGDKIKPCNDKQKDKFNVDRYENELGIVDILTVK